MLKIIAITLLGAIIIILILAALKPNTFRVRRQASIKAPPGTIFAFLNDFHKWGAWSPWEKLDPAMERTFSGAETGKGALYAWNSRGKAGVGSMEITDTNAPSKLTLALNFIKPFKNSCVVDFTLEPQGDSTTVAWDMEGPTPFVAKIMHVLFNMDKMVGKDFERGLANLKTVSENAPGV